MRAVQGHPGAAVSSTVTKRNPRPRKYASASERQAAYRARAPEVCFRAEGKTVDTLDKIAADLDVSRADLLLSMTKFALTNHDWARFGLTHRPLPYQYGIDEPRKVNPMKKPTPAQLAARARFAEMARSGAFKRKASKRKKNPASKFSVGDEVKFAPAVVKRMGDARTKNMRGTIVEIMSAGKVALVDTHGTFVSEEGSSVRGIPTANLVLDVKRNPAKKTVSQKISQLMHEGYPQKQAVAVALSEQRKGKVKRNPASGRKGSRTKLNPMAPEARSRLPSNFKYGVQTKATENWGLQAAFKTKAEAVDYAHAIAKNYPRLPIRVITFTGGPI